MEIDHDSGTFGDRAHHSLLKRLSARVLGGGRVGISALSTCAVLENILLYSMFGEKNHGLGGKCHLYFIDFKFGVDLLCYIAGVE